VGEQAEEEKVITFTIRSINDCPFVVAKGNETIDISFTFAAYVNEQHPFVDKLLREALDRGIVDNFTGYQTRDEAEVIRQAYALWDLLVSRDMRYSSITMSAAESESVGSQHVRLIEESINNSQSNCVDGSVLWVSMLRKIGIDAFLVLEPTHCYAGFYGDSQKKTIFAIETTLLGAEIDPEEVEISAVLEEAIDEELRDDVSFTSFVVAMQSANKKFSESIKKSPETNNKEFRVIDIATARKLGILPIAFQNKEQFLAYDHSVSEEEDAEAEDDEESNDEE
jgi:hypothetical protein